MLITLGALGAKLGGAKPTRAAARVVIGGAIAMAAAALVGTLLGTAVA